MKQRVAGVVLCALMIGACGGDGDEAEPGGSVDEWCAVAERIADLETTNPDLLSVDAADADSSLADYRSLLGEAAAVAPDDVLSDANAIADGVDQFVKVGESVDFDFGRLDADALLAAAGGVLELDEPLARVRAYNARQCGLEAATTTTTAVPPTTEPAPVTVPPTDPPATDPAPPVTADATRFTGDPDSEFCVVAREIDALGERFDTVFFFEPDEIEALMTEMLEMLAEAEAVAPPEIAAAVAMSVRGFTALDDAFAASGYDPLNTDLSVLDELDAEMDAANELIDQYNSDVCGIEIEPDETDDESDFDPSAGTIRDQAIAEFVAQGFTAEEAACIFDSIDFTAPDVLDDTAAIAEVLTLCGIDFERLAELG